MNILDGKYQLNDPKSYLVFVPILSCFIQQCSYSSIIPLENFKVENFTSHGNPLDDLTREENDRAYRFVKMSRWHLLGSSTQLVVSIVALKVFGFPIFVSFALLALFELGSVLRTVMTNKPAYREYYPNGDVKTKQPLYLFLANPNKIQKPAAILDQNFRPTFLSREKGGDIKLKISPIM